MFATKNEIRFAPESEVTKVSVYEYFKLAPFYLYGWVDQDVIYELNDLQQFKEEEPFYLFLNKVLDIKLPNKVQFSCSPSHIRVVAEYEEFKAEIVFNTVRYIHFVEDSLTKAKEGRSTKEEMESFRHSAKEILMQNFTTYVTPEAYQKNPEALIKVTVYLIAEILINFWTEY